MKYTIADMLHQARNLDTRANEADSKLQLDKAAAVALSEAATELSRLYAENEGFKQMMADKRTPTVFLLLPEGDKRKVRIVSVDQGNMTHLNVSITVDDLATSWRDLTHDEKLSLRKLRALADLVPAAKEVVILFRKLVKDIP